jgi:hypothetical protein
MNKDQRKQLASQYDLAKRPAGVYRLRHRESGKAYIGSGPDLNAMWNRLHFELNMGVSMKKALQADWKKYGASAFAYEVLDTYKPPENGRYHLMKELEQMENLWLKELQPYGEKGYHTEQPNPKQ